MGNAERIRAAFEALNGGDPSVFLDMYDPDVELFVPATAELDAGVFRGAREVERWFGHGFAQWDDLQWEVVELTEWGPHVAMLIHSTRRGKRSQVPLEDTFLSVYSFRNGRIVSMAHLGRAEGAQPAGPAA